MDKNYLEIKKNKSELYNKDQVYMPNQLHFLL